MLSPSPSPELRSVSESSHLGELVGSSSSDLCHTQTTQLLLQLLELRPERISFKQASCVIYCCANLSAKQCFLTQSSASVPLSCLHD